MQLKQPQGNLHLKREGDTAPAITTDELMAKVIEAAGGEANLRKHHSWKLVISSNLENEGVQADTVEYADGSGAGGKTSTFYALGKKIAITRDYFDGDKGGSESTLSPDKPYGPKEIAAARIESDMYGPANWKHIFGVVVVKRTSKVADEEVYVIQMTPKAPGLQPETDYVSTKTFLVLKRERSEISAVGPLPATETFEDYRDVDGVKVAFKHTLELLGATSVDTTRSVEFDLPTPQGTFAPSPQHISL